MRLRIFELSLCVALASCAGPLTKEQHGQIHSVAVISLLGDRISLSKTALLFGGIGEQVPVAEIGFDAFAEQSVIACGKNLDPSRTFRTIDIPKEPLMDKLNDGVLSAYNATMWRIRPDIAAWVAQNPVDAVVIVREVNRQVAGGPSLYFHGVGVRQWGDRPPIVQAVFGLVIWDGKTLAEITDLSDAPASTSYHESVDIVLGELKAGHRLPELETKLKQLISSGACAMVRAANL